MLRYYYYCIPAAAAAKLTSQFAFAIDLNLDSVWTFGACCCEKFKATQRPTLAGNKRQTLLDCNERLSIARFDGSLARSHRVAVVCLCVWLSRSQKWANNRKLSARRIVVSRPSSVRPAPFFSDARYRLAFLVVCLTTKLKSCHSNLAAAAAARDVWLSFDFLRASERLNKRRRQ